MVICPSQHGQLSITTWLVVYDIVRFFFVADAICGAVGGQLPIAFVMCFVVTEHVCGAI